MIGPKRAMRLADEVIALALSLLFGAAAWAEVPPEIAKQNREIGPVVELAKTAAVYAPLQSDEPYANTFVIRNHQYGASARAVLDVFKPAAPKGKPPILIFLTGGPGDIHGNGQYGKRLDDNIMVWAVKNGMVGLLVQRESGQGVAWDQGAKNVGEAIAWARKNAALHGGDPNRVYIWGYSAGAWTLSTYLSHPEFYPDGKIGVRAAVLSSGPYDLAPYRAPSAPVPGGPDALLAHSVLEGMKALTIPIFVTATEFDPPPLVELAHELGDQLCMAGHCPRYVRFKDHGHMSAMYSVNTSDVSVSGQVLDFIRSAP
jgi:acetyl esterase/lipase